jgi:acylphosphatase
MGAARVSEQRLARLHGVVSGRVQGVGFRMFVRAQARALGLSGWVRNQEGGRSVEIVAEGPRDRLERLHALCAVGPVGAWVDETVWEWQEPTRSFTSFEIRR